MLSYHALPSKYMCFSPFYLSHFIFWGVLEKKLHSLVSNEGKWWEEIGERKYEWNILKGNSAQIEIFPIEGWILFCVGGASNLLSLRGQP